MKYSLITLFILLSFICKSQPFINLGIDKTRGRNTNYSMPTGAIGAGYKIGIITGEIGIKSNWQEYYTPVYMSFGLETKSKLLLGVNGGAAYLLNIPQLDRYYDGENYTVIHEGYTTKGICVGYLNGKIGYDIFEGLKPYVSVSYCSKLIFYGVGLKFQLD